MKEFVKYHLNLKTLSAMILSGFEDYLNLDNGQLKREFNFKMFSITLLASFSVLFIFVAFPITILFTFLQQVINSKCDPLISFKLGTFKGSILNIIDKNLNTASMPIGIFLIMSLMYWVILLTMYYLFYSIGLTFSGLWASYFILLILHSHLILAVDLMAKYEDGHRLTKAQKRRFKIKKIV